MRRTPLLTIMVLLSVVTVGATPVAAGGADAGTASEGTAAGACEAADAAAGAPVTVDCGASVDPNEDYGPDAYAFYGASAEQGPVTYNGSGGAVADDEGYELLVAGTYQRVQAGDNTVQIGNPYPETPYTPGPAHTEAEVIYPYGARVGAGYLINTTATGEESGAAGCGLYVYSPVPQCYVSTY